MINTSNISTATGCRYRLQTGKSDPLFESKYLLSISSLWTPNCRSVISRHLVKWVNFLLKNITPYKSFSKLVDVIKHVNCDYTLLVLLNAIAEDAILALKRVSAYFRDHRSCRCSSHLVSYFNLTNALSLRNVYLCFERQSLGSLFVRIAYG